ncbi:JmjC domain-containing protein 4 [Tieghemiomyces parasiticus]|uniref:JmjC domain-containing protein 4 n=1 Tax=Tieghemiomyces parasiticus TaxID=78921 RepID=A0A9W7ZMD0_9FUNG|nr:JmjC domain-containing protein 4 [Tieghemiomyces parasiticus]
MPTLPDGAPVDLPDAIPYRPHLSPNQFYREHLRPNLPVLLGPALTAHWPARQRWARATELPWPADFPALAKLRRGVTEWASSCPLDGLGFLNRLLELMERDTVAVDSDEGTGLAWRCLVPDTEHLVHRFGTARVCVTDCRADPATASDAEICRECTLAEYVERHLRPNQKPETGRSEDGGGSGTVWHTMLDRLREVVSTRPPEKVDPTLLAERLGEFGRHPRPSERGSSGSCATPRVPAPIPPPGHHYLKDWHMVRQFPDARAYTTPEVFADDWLNAFWDHRTASAATADHPDADDYRFVYIGAHGTWTPFHTDVFGSYSWSSNVCGIKHWILYPPSTQQPPSNATNHPTIIPTEGVHDIYRPDLAATFPTLQHPQTRRYHIYQLPGETLFVPSGWAHQVENIGDTISINHNWGNAANVVHLATVLQRELDRVEAAIADCRDLMDAIEWRDHCQVVLRANHGMNYEEFYRYVAFNAERLMATTNAEQPPDSWLIPGYIEWSLGQLRKALGSYLLADGRTAGMAWVQEARLLQRRIKCYSATTV